MTSDLLETGSNDWNGGDTGAPKWNNGVDAADTGASNGDFGAGDYGTGASADHLYGATGMENGAGAGGGDGGTCRNCGQEGHFARECPEPKKMGACFNCGEEGHSKADCTKPRVFTGTCKICEQKGHRADDCPDKPPPICKNCRAEGHEAKDCENKREFDLNRIADKTVDEALAMLKAASEDRDLDDFKDAFKIYTKADRNVTYEQAERRFRKMDLNVYLIALTKEPGTTFTNVDLQGNIDREFSVGFYLAHKAQRPKLKERWPESPEDNLERLKNAGQAMDRGVPLCNRCGELGHMSRKCPQEEDEAGILERTEVKCANCDKPGHRVRDCPQERTFGKPRAPRECKICGSTEHIAKECDQREVMKCRNCNEEGHKSADCDKPRAPRDPATIQCRNCDEFGHTSRECPKPRDYSRVTCTNCGEKGHTKVRCKQPVADEGDAGASAYDTNAAAAGGDSTFNDTPAPGAPGAAGEWQDAPAQPAPVVVSGGGGGW